MYPPEGRRTVTFGHELAVRAPVLVRHLDHLLGRRPEVVGELGAFDHDADVVGRAGEKPSAVPMMWSSAIGALKTRAAPNSCCMPLVTLKTPPLSR